MMTKTMFRLANVFAGLMAILIVITMSPTMSKVAIGNSHGIYRIKTKNKLVALTFDDGPDPRFTPAILDILKKYKVPATFFVVGKNVEDHPEILLRTIHEGHQVGNHTMTHPILNQLKPEEIYKELKDCSRTIWLVSGEHPIYFRSPKGLTSAEVQKIGSSLGMEQILWTVTMENHAAKTPKEMADRVLRKVGPGYIILLHDGRLDRSKTVAALPLLLEGLQKRGYKVVPLSELLSIETTDNSSW
ncbi:polysaccharide deacetylase family protein [Desulfotomaculum nigrificans]|uniref:polysaccharide deacetylase family protein n=1 Tax=Desulfotomaculum nigrificans TaxID=1565 RepID=UPI0001FAEC3A|nr:polysaccharide deacetylase family protein [Desulfotomaculum nigrificans]